MTSFYGGGAASTSGGGGSSVEGALIFKGTLGISDDGATVLVLPDTHEEGWTYLVVTAGIYAGQLCEKGDFVICVSSGESASDLDWTVVQGNTFNTLPTPTASDEGKIIAVDALGNYVLIDKPSSGGGTTENLPDPSEADEGKILSVGADGNYTLIDNPVDNKLDKNNGTATGTTTFDKAQANRLELLVDGESIGGFRSIDLTPAVTDNGDDSSMRFVPLFIGEPIKDSHAATKKYVDDKADSYLPLSGGTITGSIDAGENTVTNLKEPENGTDATTKNYVDDEVAKAANDKIDAIYNSLVKKAETADEVNQLFKDWWNANWEDGSSTYNDMLERWFGKVLDDDKVYGVKLPLFETSTSPQGEYIEDSVGLTITNSTDEEVGQNDFAKTPQFWCVEVAAEKNADGSHTIYACEFIDDIDVVRNGGPDNGKHLVWVLQKNTYVREYEESGYSYIKIQCHPADGFVQWPQGTDRTGHTYSYIANPKYAAGIDDEGNIGCRTGLKPTCYMSMDETIQAWRARGPQYSGSSACFYKWAYIMYALLNAKKGEDVGCNNYNYQYAATVSESGVSRIILASDQANNLYVGSNVIIGNTEDNNDRGQAAMYSLVKLRKISSIEEVNIEEDVSSYKAVYIDVPDETTFDTTAGTTHISTMPFYSGWTDTVKGTIGTKYGTNLNKQPFLLQKVELMNGAYNYASDELDQWSQQDDTHYLYNFYLCEDQTKVSTNGTITDDYIKKENTTLSIDTAVYTTNNSWYYIEDNLTDNNFKMLSPKKFSTSAGSGTGTRDGFYLSYAASGVKAPAVWAYLQYGGVAGLSCRHSGNGPSWSGWNCTGGGPGLSG